ncbi:MULTISPECIES: TadE family type IV pilus minor pilin [unclassified Gordonia (in: high G+C Gram-positive bacteria)]|uniref:TadE family type IV pilus minor pilin n=1 Tax=unclassified Gordonia (in: high G+C Gram-positive bacteria) TaxID=2657482 RepID=UPI002D1FBA2C|nr:TadE family type IV pilus minor pilin [Gordonia sp. (in: high G+C Gram-positive bacteria)]
MSAGYLLYRRMHGLLRDESGMATVEAAYAIAAISVVLMLCVGGLAAMTTTLRCADAAREVARLTAAGDARARSVGAAAAPGGARIAVEQRGDEVVVRVEAGVPLLPLLTVGGSAIALMEPREDDSDAPAPASP